MHQNHCNEVSYISQLRHYLPSQAPLKDFVHHNTLHHYQNLPFKEALEKYYQDLGVKNIYDLNQYLDWYQKGFISDASIEFVLKFYPERSNGLKKTKNGLRFLRID